MNFSAASLCAVLQAHLPAQATGLLVAVSGGADSSCLLAAAARMRSALRSLPLRAVHVDHGLQTGSDGFRARCAALAEALQVPLSIVRVAVNAAPGESIEAAARDARYAALAALLTPGECLLTAHHREDQAETVLLQALRGGFKGLSGMPVCRRFGAGWHVRPLLDVSRSELLGVGGAPGVGFASDPMNEDLRFDRAYLRHRIWSLLEKQWPGAGPSLGRTARHVAAAQGLLDVAAAADVARLRDGDALSVTGLRALPGPQQINVLRHWIAGAAVPAPPQARLVEALRQILAATGDHLPAVLWSGHALRRYRDRIFLTSAVPPAIGPARDWPVAADATLELGGGLGRLRMVAHNGGLAAHKLASTLVVHARRGGERLKPARHAATQSVQHLCQAHGVLPWMRDALPFVFAGDALVAVGDLWLDARWCAAPGEAGFACEWQGAPMLV